mmetsp:Transcript_26730/g.30861  ORF Transcript_26730/g.30861 Transcript_26730/m.30861 type:complete len:213 (-) Transcript_26730:197-835(-)
MLRRRRIVQGVVQHRGVHNVVRVVVVVHQPIRLVRLRLVVALLLTRIGLADVVLRHVRKIHVFVLILVLRQDKHVPVRRLLAFRLAALLISCCRTTTCVPNGLVAMNRIGHQDGSGRDAHAQQDTQQNSLGPRNQFGQINVDRSAVPFTDFTEALLAQLFTNMDLLKLHGGRGGLRRSRGGGGGVGRGRGRGGPRRDVGGLGGDVGGVTNHL